MGGRLYYTAHQSDGDGELRRTDGTTDELLDEFPNAAPGRFIAAGTELFFLDPDGNLSATDGTAGDSHTFQANGSTFSALDTDQMVPVGNELFFFADDEDGHRQLWKSDGTSAGTNPITTRRARPAERPHRGRRPGVLRRSGRDQRQRALDERRHAGGDRHREGHRAGR